MHAPGNPVYPTTTEGWLRALHAVRHGAPGTTAWLVVADIAPLYRVQGVATSRQGAETMLHGPAPGDWTPEEVASRVIWGGIECSGRRLVDIFDPLPHVCWTEAPLDVARRRQARAADVGVLEVSNLRLVVSVGGNDVTYTFPEGTDAIFLTRGAREAFMYPQYAAFFGMEYVEEFRRRVGD